ncbi:MAG: Holliday junction branch migration protein RuvA [Elusimicrobiota bacterium]|jgi:Holliday junction DNA helicase RuvA|nr:Holliday junction branch migration protein RuvA [Elusimicrobiota bacterium]
MIDFLNGILESKNIDKIVIEVLGIGYEVSVSSFTYEKLPEIGKSVKIYIVEAVAGMYGGVINLYGFYSKQEREMYLLIKNEVPATGAKKALEYIDKISKSFSDFSRAVVLRDSAMITSIFGFTKKTADKLIAALKDKISDTIAKYKGNYGNETINMSENVVAAEAISALIALGYDPFQSRTCVNKAFDGSDISLEDLIKKSLLLLQKF